MDQVIDCCAGLDVHNNTVAACVRVSGNGRRREQHVRTFGTTTAEFFGLHDWLAAHQVTHVAMESTGVYWKPVYDALEDTFTLVLVNPTHMRNVPGRKTDVQDCVWIAQLLECGLLRGSVVPPPAIRDLRDLTRYRKSLIQERTRAANRLHKVLQDAGVKLASVASDVLGVSGRAMLEALVQGTTDPDVLADLACGRLRAKLPALRTALAGRFRPHHAFLVGQLLSHLDYLEDASDTVSAKIAETLGPFTEAIARLDTIPGVNRRTAEVIVAEIWVNMQQFPSAAHLASWAGLCPGHHESAGKHLSGKTRKGSTWLRMALTEAALAAIRAKETALAVRYRRVMRHRGHKKAVSAVAHRLLEIAYHLLSRQVPYAELGAAYLDQRDREHATRRYVKQLERLGHRVILESAA